MPRGETLHSTVSFLFFLLVSSRNLLESEKCYSTTTVDMNKRISTFPDIPFKKSSRLSSHKYVIADWFAARRQLSPKTERSKSKVILVQDLLQKRFPLIILQRHDTSHTLNTFLSVSHASFPQHSFRIIQRDCQLADGRIRAFRIAASLNIPAYY